ncbi:MAG TPA: hypothetical protein VGL05_08030 [Kribbella sp.]
MPEDNSGDLVIEPTTVELYGTDGRTYHTAAGSKFAVDGLKNGTLTVDQPKQPEEEVAAGGAEVPAAGDGPKSGNADGSEGPGDGKADSGGSGRRGGRSGTA